MAKTPTLSTMANHSQNGNAPTVPAVMGKDTIQDVLTVGNVAQNAAVSATFDLYAPTTTGGEATCGQNLAYSSSSPVTRVGPGQLASEQVDPTVHGKKAGTYKWQATVWVNGRKTTLDCGATTAPDNEVSFVDPEVTATYTGQKLDVTDRARSRASSSGGGESKARFRLYDNSSCTGTPITDQTVTIDDATGIATSSEVSVQNTTTADKTFYWLVEFSGNDFNDGSVSTCGKETFTIHPDGSGTDP